MKTININGKEVPVIESTKVVETFKNKKTGEIYKNKEDWVSKNIPASDIRKDVVVNAPGLDLFPKTK